MAYNEFQILDTFRIKTMIENIIDSQNQRVERKNVYRATNILEL